MPITAGSDNRVVSTRDLLIPTIEKAKRTGRIGARSIAAALLIPSSSAIRTRPRPGRPDHLMVTHTSLETGLRVTHRRMAERICHMITINAVSSMIISIGTVAPFGVYTIHDRHMNAAALGYHI